MSSDMSSINDSAEPSGPATFQWLHPRPLWAGLSIMTMWLAVLFVGVFGGDIVSNSAGGSSASVPVVVMLLPFVLPATIAVARRGFSSPTEARHDELGEEPRPLVEPVPQQSPTRTKLA